MDAGNDEHNAAGRLFVGFLGHGGPGCDFAPDTRSQTNRLLEAGAHLIKTVINSGGTFGRQISLLSQQR